mgnify:CR=1 FL=1
MAKRDDNAVIFLLCVVIGILLPLIVWLLLRMLTVDAHMHRQEREINKAIIILREERERFKKEKEHDE